jgi:ubiquitin-protein ligase
VPEGANSRLIAAHKTFTGIGIDDEFLGDGDRPHSMSRWTGHIVDNTGARMWFVQIHCGPQYPAEPPSVKFTTKVNLEGVDQRTGLVDFARLARATSRDGFRWTEKSCIVEYLCAIRGQLLRDLGKPQPADGEHMKWPNT